MKKLAISEEREEDKYDHLTSVKCWSCDSQSGVEMPEASKDPKVPCCRYTSGSFLITKKKLPIHSIDQIPHRRCNAIHVVRTPVGSQSMGGRDKPM